MASELFKIASPVDERYFRELAKADPEELYRRTPCTYDAASRMYALRVWGDDYAIYPDALRIDCMGRSGHPAHDLFRLFVMYYLLKSRKIKAMDEWISEKDIPDGATFFRGPHTVPTRLISERYGSDITGFKKRCRQLQGAALHMADAAYRFEITPNIPVAVLYWAGDDAFPTEVTILYDRAICGQLPPDIVFVLAVEICIRLCVDG